MSSNNSYKSSEDTTVESLPLESLGFFLTPHRGHVLKIQINDWPTISSNYNIFTPEFMIDGNTCCIRITRYTSNKISVNLCYVGAGRKDWSIRIGGSIRLILEDDLSRKHNFDDNGKWIESGKGHGGVFQMPVHYEKMKSLVILLNYTLLDVWKNEKVIECDNPECDKDVRIPKMLGCGHVYCYDCCYVTVCKICDFSKCICSECFHTKK